MPHPDALARLVANEEEQAELSRRQSELSRRLSELATEHAELAQLAALATPPALSNFPTGLLQHILLWATDHDDLLRHASVCACVCSDWHRIVLSSSAYGFGWAVGARTRHRVEERRAERGRVLQVISNALRVARALSIDESRKLHLADERISDNGGRALGKALQAWSCPLALTSIDLSSNRLTAEGMAPIQAALERGFANDGLRELDLEDNSLDDAMLTRVVGAMPPKLVTLDVSNTGCGDDAIRAIAARLPALTHLRNLTCKDSPAVTQTGWLTLGAALRNNESVQWLDVSCNSGLCDEEAGAIASGMLTYNGSQGATNRHAFLNFARCGIRDKGARGIATALKDTTEMIRAVWVVVKDNPFGAASRTVIEQAAHVRGELFFIV
jgi:hypothetical protein